MSSKYPWDSAPSWARYAATDETGQSYWFEEKPYEHGGCWWTDSGRAEFISAVTISAIEERP